MVPKGWRFSNLGTVVTYKKGYPFDSNDYREEGIRVIRISDTTANSIHNDNPVYVASDKADLLIDYQLTDGDIILSTVGSRPHLLASMVGKAVKIPCDSSGALLNQNLVKLLPRSSFIVNSYLYEMVKSSRFIYYISTLVRGNANQVSITLAELWDYRFLLPPLPEQRKIAQILSTWDKAIATTERLLVNKQQQKKALMQRLLTGKQRFAGFEGEWQRFSLDSLGSTYGGLTGKTKEHFGKGKRYIPYLNIYKSPVIDLLGFELVEIQDNERQNTVQKGDIFFTTSSETPDEVGMSSVLLDDVSDLYLNSFCFGFRLHTFEQLLPEYAVHLFRSDEVRKSITKMAQGATRYNLSKKQLLGLEITVPLLDEQRQIALTLTCLDKQVSLVQKELANLKQQKKALMQQLLTGKRRVKVDCPDSATLV